MREGKRKREKRDLAAAAPFSLCDPRRRRICVTISRLISSEGREGTGGETNGAKGGESMAGAKTTESKSVYCLDVFALPSSSRFASDTLDTNTEGREIATVDSLSTSSSFFSIHRLCHNPHIFPSFPSSPPMKADSPPTTLFLLHPFLFLSLLPPCSLFLVVQSSSFLALFSSLFSSPSSMTYRLNFMDQ